MVGVLVKTEHWKPGRDRSDEGITFCDTAAPIVVLECRPTKVGSAGPTILRVMAKPLLADKGLKKAAGKPDDYLGIKLVGLNNFVLSKFRGEEELKDEKNCKL